MGANNQVGFFREIDKTLCAMRAKWDAVLLKHAGKSDLILSLARTRGLPETTVVVVRVLRDFSGLPYIGKHHE